MGFERGKIMGCSVCFAISRIADSVNALGTVDVPIRTWGFMCEIREVRSLVSMSWDQSEEDWAKGFWAMERESSLSRRRPCLSIR